MRRSVRYGVALALVASACSSPSSPDPLVIGAVYPLSGSQGSGGVQEFRGVSLAADLVNADGGVHGRPIELRTVDVPGSDAAPAAIAQLDAEGIDLVLGSYGSTISAVASTATAERNMLFWETGAVGMLPSTSDAGDLTFRVPPTGGTLGRAAIDFVSGKLAHEMHRDPRSLRYAVAFVDDVYGNTVASGAEDELRKLGLDLVATVGYPPVGYDAARIARRIAAARPDVLFVSAYLEDGIAVRRELVREHVPLVASIGTSSSYCMPEFGQRLGRMAVGVYASDKPDASIDPDGLRPQARDLLQRANDAYRARWGSDLSPPALAGFSAAWALFHDVLPEANGDTAAAVASAALEVDLPRGSLPNGSGLRFAPPGVPDAGANVEAASVIWEWVSPGHAAVIWPPAFASEPMPASVMGW
ncbi:MAG TPA: ABC transporter substrate-binding protein [Actinomycetota bacterium]